MASVRVRSRHVCGRCNSRLERGCNTYRFRVPAPSQGELQALPPGHVGIGSQGHATCTCKDPRSHVGRPPPRNTARRGGTGEEAYRVHETARPWTALLSYLSGTLLYTIFFNAFLRSSSFSLKNRNKRLTVTRSHLLIFHFFFLF